jgi:hypothetical protein
MKSMRLLLLAGVLVATAGLFTKPAFAKPHPGDDGGGDSEDAPEISPSLILGGLTAAGGVGTYLIARRNSKK